MKIDQKKRRPIPVAIAILAWVAIGLSAPFVMSLFRRDMPVEGTTVNAATIDSHLFAARQVLNETLGAVVSSGRISLALTRGVPLDANRIAAAIKSGDAKLVIARGVFDIGEPGELRRNLDAEASTPLLEAISQLKFETLTLTDASIGLTLPGGRTERFSQVEMLVTRRRATQLSMVGTGVWRGQSVDLSAVISQPPATGGRVRPDTVDATIKIKSALLETAFEGTISRGAGLNLVGRVISAFPDVRKLAREFGIRWADEATPLTAGVIGQVNWSGGTLAFEKASFAVDSQRATGALAINTDRARPLVTGTLDFETMDLAAYLDDPAASKGARALGSNGWLSPDWRSRIFDLVRLPLAKAADVDLRVSARELSYRGKALGSSAASIALRDGQLKAHVPQLSFGQGTGSGQLTADFTADQPRVDVQARLEDIDINRVGALLDAAGLLQGKATLLVDLSGVGTTWSALKTSIGGTVEVSMRDGGRLALDLNPALAVPASVTPAATTPDLARAMSRGTTTVDSLEAIFAIDGSSLVCRKATAKLNGGAVAVDMTGQLDIGQQSFTAEIGMSSQKLPAGSRLMVRGDGGGAAWTAEPVAKPDTAGASAGALPRKGT